MQKNNVLVNKKTGEVLYRRTKDDSSCSPTTAAAITPVSSGSQTLLPHLESNDGYCPMCDWEFGPYGNWCDNSSCLSFGL